MKEHDKETIINFIDSIRFVLLEANCTGEVDGISEVYFLLDKVKKIVGYNKIWNEIEL